MKVFILPARPDSGGLIHLSGGDYHYLARVRRLRPGDFFNARLPTGEPVRVQVLSLAGTRLTGQCLPPAAEQPLPAEPGKAGEVPGDALPPILLFQALPKGTKMDLIVRQAAEGGITEIVPFLSARSIPRPEDQEGRLQRWNRIIKAARQQSGSPIATTIQSPRTEEDLLAYWDTRREGYPRSLGIFLRQTPLEQGTFHDYLGNNPYPVAIVVGPEGGFSPEETARFLSAGFKPLGMGNTVLRTETAALYAAAVIRVILLESPWWTPLNHPR